MNEKLDAALKSLLQQYSARLQQSRIKVGAMEEHLEFERNSQKELIGSIKTVQLLMEKNV